jgi:hypothetical protein
MPWGPWCPAPLIGLSPSTWPEPSLPHGMSLCVGAGSTLSWCDSANWLSPGLA